MGGTERWERDIRVRPAVEYSRRGDMGSFPQAGCGSLLGFPLAGVG